MVMVVLAVKHQRSPRKLWAAAACCGMLQAIGGGNVLFQMRKMGTMLPFSWEVVQCQVVQEEHLQQ